VQYDTIETKQMQILSETAKARLRELEARTALVRLQAAAGATESSFLAERARALQDSIKQQLAGDDRPASKEEA
jgi:hypothetical protein